MSKKILVTGGAGFIGANLCGQLLKKGHRVICLDNFYCSKKSNVEEYTQNKNFTLIEHDIVDPFKTNDSIDEIYNLACPASPVHYQAQPLRTLDANTKGTENLLKLAKEKGSRILQASTSEVYGDPHIHPQNEGYSGNVNPIGIRACYDEGKRCAETYCMEYSRLYGVNTKIVRIFNTYGPKMLPNDGRVVSNFIIQILQNQDITVFGNGKQTRSFQYVTDLISGMVTMMESELTGPVNIGNPEEYSVNELAHKILALIPESSSKISFLDLPQDDPRQRKPNIELAKEKLNWTPTVKLEEGLKMTIKYFKEALLKR